MRLSPQIIPGRLIVILILGMIPATAGCGASKGSVSGSVSYKGEKLKGGTVTFVNEKKENVGVSTIEENGTYSIPKIPAGDYTVCVETESLKPPNPAVLMNKPPAGAQRPAGTPDWEARAKRYMLIPPTYNNPEQSTLKIKVTGGKQEYDIPLS
jgi:hypothetical protein